MAAPEHVSLPATNTTRAYSSPPRRAGSWLAARPGEVVEDGQPRAERLGSPGPDQGYALRLAQRFEDRLCVARGESREDAVAAGVIIALKRASLLGRAPTIHDLTVGYTVLGLLDDDAPDELVTWRREHIDGVANAHHYASQRAVADAVSAEVLRSTPATVDEMRAGSWRSVLVGA